MFPFLQAGSHSPNFITFAWIAKLTLEFLYSIWFKSNFMLQSFLVLLPSPTQLVINGMIPNPKWVNVHDNFVMDVRVRNTGRRSSPIQFTSTSPSSTPTHLNPNLKWVMFTNNFDLSWMSVTQGDGRDSSKPLPPFPAGNPKCQWVNVQW